MSDVGTILRKMREDANLTQQRLAELIDVSPQYVSDVERGRYGPSWRFLVNFANAAGANLITLLRETGLADEETIALEQEIAAIIKEMPEAEGVFLWARDKPRRLREMIRYARYLMENETEEDDALAEPSGGAAAATTE